MAGDPTNPIPGELSIDASAIQSFAVDLAPSEMVGMLSEQSGYNDVVAEITSGQPAWGEKVGITQTIFNSFQTASERIAAVDRYLTSAAKLVEILTETRKSLDNGRQRTVYNIAENVDRYYKSTGDKNALAAYEKTRTYRSAIAAKGQKTKAAKNSSTTDSSAPAGG